MVENDIKESLVLDDVFQSNLNMYQLENKKNNETDPNLWLKHNYRFILSIIISMFCIVGYLITLEGLFDIKNFKYENNEFNINDFYIINGTCTNTKYIGIEAINDYFLKINNFNYYKKLIIYFGKISIFICILLMSILFYIKWAYEKGEEIKNNCLISSIVLGIILFVGEFFIFNLLLYLFLRLFEIINFLENNINNKCIILLNSDYSIKVLKHLIKILMVLEILKIFNIQLLIYFLKQLIILNNFFYYEDKDINLDIRKESSNQYLNQNI